MADGPVQASQPDRDEATAITSFLRMERVIRLTGLGRSTIYRLMARGEFPKPVRLASRAVGWRTSDLERWSQGRPRVVH